MKYLNRFDSFNESICNEELCTKLNNDQYQEFISKYDYDNMIESDRIKTESILSPFKFKIQETQGPRKVIILWNVNMFITKHDDDWFLIYMKTDRYLCDGVDGLNDFKNKLSFIFKNPDILLFESINSEKLYEEIDFNQYDEAWYEREEISNMDVTKLKSLEYLIDISCYRYKIYTSIYSFQKNSNRNNFTIMCNDDNWYYVRHELYSFISTSSDNFFYKCDAIEGVIQLFNDIASWDGVI